MLMGQNEIVPRSVHIPRHLRENRARTAQSNTKGTILLILPSIEDDEDKKMAKNNTSKKKRLNSLNKYRNGR